MDAEKLCISKIKAECGPQFTNQLEGMLKVCWDALRFGIHVLFLLTRSAAPILCYQDIEISSDIMSGFKHYIAAKPGSIVDMNVLVLTSGFWPSYRAFDCLLPTELVRAQKVGAQEQPVFLQRPGCFLCMQYVLFYLCYPCSSAGVCRILSFKARRSKAGMAQHL